MAARKKQVYKVTYPNGKVYIGLDLTGTITFLGTAEERITADLADYRLDLTVRKQILWESETVTDAEARAMEVELVREHRANDPAVGYNLTPKFTGSVDKTSAPSTHWYARPEGDCKELRLSPQLFSGEKTSSPEQVRLREFTDHTLELFADSRVDGPSALRLDVGLPTGDLLQHRDLDNYAYPLARRLQQDHRDLVSVWCTKRRGTQSFVRIDAAREVPAPSTKVLHVRTTASWEAHAAKQQIHAAVADASELPAGSVRLELAFVIGAGSNRNWLNLWKPTIDSLGSLLGHDEPYKVWNPRDDRVTELGMHVSVDSSLGNDVLIDIAATPA